MGRLKPTPDYSLTPTGNPLTEKQIEKWRSFLLNEVGVYFGHSSPVGANVLCDMAKAALRLVASEKREWIEAGSSMPESHRPLLVTNNIDARNAFGQPSHVWLIWLLQEIDDPEGGYCGYSGENDLIENITHWRYAL